MGSALRSSLGWGDQGRLPGRSDACTNPREVSQTGAGGGWVCISGGPGGEHPVKDKKGKQFDALGNHSN